MGKARVLAVICICALCVIIINTKNTLAAENKKLQWESFGGAEVTSEGEAVEYFSVGMMRTLSEPKWIILGRVLGLHVDYKFEVEDEVLEGELSSVTPYIGIRRLFDGYDGSISLLSGPDIEWVEQEHTDAPARKERKNGISVQGELDKWWPSERNLSLILNYKSVDDFFWGRLRVKDGILKLGDGSLFVGVEGVGMGNADFGALQIGALTELTNVVSNLSVALKAGYKHSSSFTESAYTGIEFYFSF